MTFVIASACIDVKDRSCVEVCPVDCIFSEDDDRICYIEPEVCIDCGVCVSACPVQAIFSDQSMPADETRFVAINALWFDDKDAARTMVTERADQI